MIPIKQTPIIIKQTFPVSLVNTPINAITPLRIITGGPGLNVLMIGNSSQIIFSFSLSSSFNTVWTAGNISFVFEKFSNGTITQTITKTYTKTDLIDIGGTSKGFADNFNINIAKFDSMKISIDTTAATITAASGDLSMIISLV